jgi:hypothetical protein
MRLQALGRLAPAVFVLLIVSPGTVRACSCVSLSNGCKMALNPGDVVFLARAISKVEVREFATDGDSKGIATGYAIHLRTTENFQGAAQPGQEIVVSTGQGNGDCGVPFIVGTSYLVHASTYNGQLTTNICAGTVPEVMVGGTLKELRALRDGGRVDDVFGTVAIAPDGVGFEDLAQTRPLSNVPVHVTGSSGATFSAMTDEHGAYSFASLPRDIYRFEQDLPPGLSTWQSTDAKPPTVEVDDKGGTGAGCQVDVFSRPDGQISGTVIDGNGQGVSGFVTIEPADPIEAQAAFRRGGLPGCEMDDGNFSLPHLAPGRYRLIFYAKIGNNINLRHPFYWPPANDVPNSTAIELGFGQHIDNVRIEVSATAIAR